MIERDDGWCDWVTPIMDGYRMSCCDCGLVHDMQFTALRKKKDLPDGAWAATPLDIDRYRVQFRARRNNRSTAAVRREKRLTAKRCPTNRQSGLHREQKP